MRTIVPVLTDFQIGVMAGRWLPCPPDSCSHGLQNVTERHAPIFETMRVLKCGSAWMSVMLQPIQFESIFTHPIGQVQLGVGRPS